VEAEYAAAFSLGTRDDIEDDAERVLSRVLSDAGCGVRPRASPRQPTPMLVAFRSSAPAHHQLIKSARIIGYARWLRTAAGRGFLPATNPTPRWAGAPTGAVGSANAKLPCGVVRPVQASNRQPTLSAIAKVFLIPAFSFQGSDSVPGMLLAKQRPKVPAALREPLAKPLLERDR
jgi:hypothetical protein